MEELRRLYCGQEFTDEFVAMIKKAKNLESLDLSRFKITDKSLAYIRENRKLKYRQFSKYRHN